MNTTLLPQSEPFQLTIPVRQSAHFTGVPIPGRSCGNSESYFKRGANHLAQKIALFALFFLLLGLANQAHAQFPGGGGPGGGIGTLPAVTCTVSPAVFTGTSVTFQFNFPNYLAPVAGFTTGNFSLSSTGAISNPTFSSIVASTGYTQVIAAFSDPTGAPGTITCTLTNANGLTFFGSAVTISNLPLSSTAITSGLASVQFSGTFSALTTVGGTASSSTSINVSGSNLAANVTATAPSGFDVSLDNSTWSGSGGSKTLTETSGALASTPVYIRLDAGDAANSYSGNVLLTSTGATSVNVAVPSSTVTAPPTTVVSIIPAGTSPTNAITVGFTVTFAAPLTTPPSTGDFSLSNSVGVTGTVNSVSGSGTTYDVNVTNVSGNGTLELDMTSGSDAVPTISNVNVPFTGSAYTINQTPPVISNVTFASNDANGSGTAIIGDQVTLGFAVSEAVQTPVLTIGSSSVTATTPDNVNYTVTYTLQASDSPDASGNVPYTIGLTDLAGNTASNTELTAGDPEVAFNNTPTISLTGTPTALTTPVGTASASTSFNVSGFNLATGNLTATAPAGFDVSADNATWSASGGSITIAETGTLASTPVYIRLDAGDPANSYSGNVVITGGGAASVNEAMASSIVAAPPVISYVSQQIYTAGTAATPLTPTSSNVAAQAYSSTSVNLGSGLAPEDVAVDASGNLYVNDGVSKTVKKIPAGGGAPVTIGTGTPYMHGIAVDAAGNVYLADYESQSIKKIPAGGGPPVNVGSHFNEPYDVAVDAAGNIYVVDIGNNNVVKIPVGGGAQVTIASGFNNPTGLAVDAAGNVYVVDYGINIVKEIPVGGGAPFVIGSGFFNPTNVAVDAAGNVYVSDINTGNGSIEEILVGDGSTTTVFSGLGFTDGVAIDAAGNLYVANVSGGNSLPKIRPLGGYYTGPFLPAGLVLDVNTGVISGTPTTPAAATNYTITAYNAAGVSTTSVVSIGVAPAPPTTAATGLAFTATTQTATTAGWTNGNGTARAVFMAAATSGSPAPANLTAYNANAVFGTGDQIGSTGWYCVYNGTGSTANITGLSPGTTYQAMVVEYSGTGSLVGYLTTPGAGNPAGVTTLTTVASITPVGKSSTNATTVDYTVTFASALTAPPSTGDFSLSNSVGVTGSINSVTGSGTTYDVNVTNVSGNGTLELDMTAGSDVAPAISNLPFTGGTTLTIDQTPPTAAIGAPSVTSVSGNGTNSVSYIVTYADANFSSSDLTNAGISLNTTGTASGTINVTGAGTSYTVTISNISGGGTLGINLAGGYASDQAGNTDPGAGPSATFNVISSDATLSGIGLSAGSLSPAFTAGNTGYSVNVPNSVNSITITPTTNFGSATVTVNGTSASTPVSLTVGQTAILVVVTAQDGVTTNTYTVTITRAPNTNLGSLYLSKGTLSPAFITATTSYTASVANSVSSLTATATAQNSLATITVNGTAVKSGTASGSIPLNVGPNTITTVITGQDGITTNTYTIVVTRAASNNDNLSALTTSTGSITPTFAQATTAYSLSVANVIASISVTPTTADPTATIMVNGAAVTSGSASGAINLNVGANTINVAVLARDGVTTKTYTLTVTRVAASNDNLSALTASAAFSPAFAVATTAYTASVANSVATLTLTPTTADPNATVTVNGAAVASGTASGAIALNVGSNTINVLVTAANGVTQKTYSIIVTRAPGNATLSALAVSTSSLTPAFNASTTSYNVSVANVTTSITLTPTVAVNTSTVKVNGVAVTSGTASGAISLNVGANAIPVVVTAGDGQTTQTYTVTVTRAAASNDNLSSLKISQGTLTPAFAVATTSYTASVANTVTSMTVTPATSDPNATVMVNGAAVTSGSASGAISLNVGPNTINVLVTAANGVTQKTYTVVVTRAASSNDNLSALSTSTGTITPNFAQATTSYNLSVANVTSSIAVTPTTADPTATVKVNTTAVTSGSASGSISLNVGSNTISVAVVAQDGVTTKTYTITVTRAAASNDNLAALSMSSGALSPTFAVGTTSYTASVANSVASTTVTPTTADPNATITVNGAAVVSGTASGAIALAVGSNTVSVLVTAANGVTQKTYTVTVTRAAGSADAVNPISVTQPTETPQLADDGIVVHKGVSPNGDGIEDFLQIDNIDQYPDNHLLIMNRSGLLVYEAKGYDNSTKVFDGHSNKTGQMQLPGTYFFALDYTVNGIVKHKTGFLVLKY